MTDDKQHSRTVNDFSRKLTPEEQKIIIEGFRQLGKNWRNLIWAIDLNTPTQ